MVLKRKIQDSAGDRVLMAMIYLCLIVILLAVLYPLLWVISASFSDPFQIRQGKLWLMPVGFQLEGYRLAFSFSTSIPEELRDAAKVDGCGDGYFFFRIVMPLSKAIMAVLVLFLAVSYWNSYFNPMIFLTDRSKYPLALYLREILLTTSTNASTSRELDPAAAMKLQTMAQVIKYGVIVVSTLPIICVYPFLQKYFVKGVMIGSVKG